MTFVRQMLDLKSKFDKIILESFRNEKKMQKKLKGRYLFHHNTILSPTLSLPHVSFHVLTNTLSHVLTSPTKDAFEEFVNLDARCASYLAAFLDEQLKRCITYRQIYLLYPIHLSYCTLLNSLVCYLFSLLSNE